MGSQHRQSEGRYQLHRCNFGGQVAWLWHGYVGPEFLANWTPSFDVTSALIDGSPHVANYMANAIGVFRLGADGQFQPFISGASAERRLARTS
jgi:hypothetical protein